MFRWLKRRALREQKTLLWQNELAATDSEAKLRLTVKGEYEIADHLDDLARFATGMREMGVTVGGLSSEDTTHALRVNKELRRIFEIAYDGRPSEFDPKYRPVGGWKFFLEHNS